MRRCGVLFLVLAACGGDEGGAAPDAAVAGDAAIDVVADAPSGRVAITVTRSYEGEGTLPLVGADVYFQHPDGRLAAFVEADANGQASAIVEVGGYVTVYDDTKLFTIVDVQPGDELGLDTRFLRGGGVRMTLAYPLASGATQYTLRTPCGAMALSGDGSDPINVELCEPTIDFVVLAQDGNGVVLGSLRRDDVTPADNATLDLTADAYVAATTTAVMLSNVPSTAGEVAITTLYRATDSWRALHVLRTIAPREAASATTGPVAVPALANVHATTIAIVPPTTFATSASLEWGPPAPTTSIDLLATLLHDITGPTAFDAAARTVTWPTETTSRIAPDAAHAQLAFMRGTQRWQWSIAAPYAGGTLALPVLPEALAMFEPTADELTSKRISTVKLSGGYPAVKRNMRLGQAPELAGEAVLAPLVSLASDTGAAAYTVAN